MSDIYDPYADPYGAPPEEDDAEYDDLYTMLATMYSTGMNQNPQMLNVPFTKGIEGMGSTDPLRNVKSQQTNLKSARSLMGFDPLQAFAGPEFEPYVSAYEMIATEAAGDPYAEALLADLDSGVGALAV